MVLHHDEDFPAGLTLLVQDAGKESGMMLDFGIIALNGGGTWTDASDLERAVLLIKGSVCFEWNSESRQAVRRSCFDENPEVLHVPAGMPITLTAGDGGAELVYEACYNKKEFEGTYYGKDDIRSDIFGGGVLNETSIRTVRTVFDGENAELSNMVLGEVVNHPGKWSSYPPHDHPHPEIYHYRLFPQQGFGVSLLDENAAVVKNRSTSLIPRDTTHSQVAGAGYAMYYIWMIPHLPGDRWLPTTRYFRKEHKWLLDKNVKIWPERPYEETI